STRTEPDRARRGWAPDRKDSSPRCLRACCTGRCRGSRNPCLFRTARSGSVAKKGRSSRNRAPSCRGFQCKEFEERAGSRKTPSQDSKRLAGIPAYKRPEESHTSRRARRSITDMLPECHIHADGDKQEQQHDRRHPHLSLHTCQWNVLRHPAHDVAEFGGV